MRFPLFLGDTDGKLTTPSQETDWEVFRKTKFICESKDAVVSFSICWEFWLPHFSSWEKSRPMHLSQTECPLNSVDAPTKNIY